MKCTWIVYHCIHVGVSTIGDFSIIQKKRDVATKLHASFARGGVVLQLLSTVFKIHAKKSLFTIMRAKKRAIFTFKFKIEMKSTLEFGARKFKYLEEKTSVKTQNQK